MAQESGKSPQIKWEGDEWSISLPLEDGRVLNGDSESHRDSLLGMGRESCEM